MSEWFQWDSLDEFNTWHENLMLSLGYPLTPVNQATGIPDETAQKTFTYTIAADVEGKWIAFVETEHAEGLTATDLRIPKRVIP